MMVKQYILLAQLHARMATMLQHSPVNIFFMLYARLQHTGFNKPYNLTLEDCACNIKLIESSLAKRPCCKTRDDQRLDTLTLGWAKNIT